MRRLSNGAAMKFRTIGRRAAMVLGGVALLALAGCASSNFVTGFFANASVTRIHVLPEKGIEPAVARRAMLALDAVAEKERLRRDPVLEKEWVAATEDPVGVRWYVAQASGDDVYVSAMYYRDKTFSVHVSLQDSWASSYRLMGVRGKVVKELREVFGDENVKVVTENKFDPS